MRAKFILWSIVLISSLILTGLCVRSLALQGIPYSSNLSTRGLCCLIICVIFGKKKGLRLFPRRPQVQFCRALIAGLALTLLTLSYSWLSASTVSVLSNIDVPLIIALGPLIGIASSNKKRILSLISISFLVIYVSGLGEQPNLIYGLVSLGLGTLLLCFGYLFIKKSMSEENEAVTIAVPSLAIIVFGLIHMTLFPNQMVTWTLRSSIEAVFSGIGMFFAYYSTMKLYAMSDLATAEFPGLLSSIVIQPIEFWLLDSPLELTYFFSSVFYVMLIYLMVKKSC